MKKRAVKQFLRRVLVFLLVLSLIVPQFGGALTAYAIAGPDVAFGGGDGTAAHPYEIATAEQLDHVREHLTENFILTSDINLDVAPYNVEDGWLPIGEGWPEDRAPSSFQGTFNGNWHTISGLMIHRPALDFVGLFGALETEAGKPATCTVEKLAIKNANVTGKNTVGILAGCSVMALIQKVSVEGVVKGEETVGGLIGDLGGNNNPAINVNNSYAIANVTGIENVGGQFGYAMDIVIMNTYSAGTITLPADPAPQYTGGLNGRGSNTVIIPSSYYDSISGMSDANTKGGSVKTTEEMKTQTTYLGWDFTAGTGVWEFKAANAYPSLQAPDMVKPVAVIGGTSSQIKHPKAGNTVDYLQSSESGYIYLVKDSETVTDKASLETLVTGKKALKVTVAQPEEADGSPKNYSITLTDDLMVGTYRAYAIDGAENVSDPTGANSVVITKAPLFILDGGSHETPSINSIKKSSADVLVNLDMNADVYTFCQLETVADITDPTTVKSNGAKTTFASGSSDLAIGQTGLLPSTKYEVFTVAESSEGDLSDTVIKREFTTLGSESDTVNVTTKGTFYRVVDNSSIAGDMTPIIRGTTKLKEIIANLDITVGATYKFFAGADKAAVVTYRST